MCFGNMLGHHLRSRRSERSLSASITNRNFLSRISHHELAFASQVGSESNSSSGSETRSSVFSVLRLMHSIKRLTRNTGSVASAVAPRKCVCTSISFSLSLTDLSQFESNALLPPPEGPSTSIHCFPSESALSNAVR